MYEALIYWCMGGLKLLGGRIATSQRRRELKAFYTSSLRPHTLIAEGLKLLLKASYTSSSRPHTLVGQGLVHYWLKASYNSSLQDEDSLLSTPSSACLLSVSFFFYFLQECTLFASDFPSMMQGKPETSRAGRLFKEIKILSFTNPPCMTKSDFEASHTLGGDVIHT